MHKTDNRDAALSSMHLADEFEHRTRDTIAIRNDPKYPDRSDAPYHSSRTLLLVEVPTKLSVGESLVTLAGRIRSLGRTT